LLDKTKLAQKLIPALKRYVKSKEPERAEKQANASNGAGFCFSEFSTNAPGSESHDYPMNIRALLYRFG
jgi:hypothetical protein